MHFDTDLRQFCPIQLLKCRTTLHCGDMSSLNDDEDASRLSSCPLWGSGLAVREALNLEQIVKVSGRLASIPAHGVGNLMGPAATRLIPFNIIIVHGCSNYKYLQLLSR